MYVSYEEYESLTLADNLTLDEATYSRYAAVADAIIDDWTLERVGRAVAAGEQLPAVVQLAYSAIISACPALAKSSEQGERLTSFSNGVDSFGFDVASVASELKERISWAYALLPIEWVSGVVDFEGGVKYAG